MKFYTKRFQFENEKYNKKKSQKLELNKKILQQK